MCIRKGKFPLKKLHPIGIGIVPLYSEYSITSVIVNGKSILARHLQTLARSGLNFLNL